MNPHKQHRYNGEPPERRHSCRRPHTPNPLATGNPVPPPRPVRYCPAIGIAFFLYATILALIIWLIYHAH